MGKWISINEELPPEKVVVKTKINDINGKRNIQELVWNKHLWWCLDMSSYVYYHPTHWYKE